MFPAPQDLCLWSGVTAASTSAAIPLAAVAPGTPMETRPWAPGLCAIPPPDE
jgi:hypothetical protein